MVMGLIVYFPLAQHWRAPLFAVVRTNGDPLTLTSTVRRIVAAVDPELPVSDVRTMEERLGLETAPRRTQTAVLALFACSAMLLAGLGLHGLLSFGVSQRRQEIGVRVALGATGMRVVRLVVGEGLVLAVAGAVAGLGLAERWGGWHRQPYTGRDQHVSVYRRVFESIRNGGSLHCATVEILAPVDRDRNHRYVSWGSCTR